MKIRKLLIIVVFFGLTLLAGMRLNLIKPPVMQKSLSTESVGDIVLSEPLWGSHGLALVFVDTKKYPAHDLGQRLSAGSISVAIIDAAEFLNDFTAESGQCLDAQKLATSIDAWLKFLPEQANDKLIISGIADGALLPFINALSDLRSGDTNVSVGFSVDLSNELALCPPLLTQHRQQKHELVASPVLKSNWRSIWTDQPATDTALFIRALGDVETRIADYDTPLDKVLATELQNSINQTDQPAVPMPVVESPTPQHSDSLTLFYSGDGGWRDLDRIVAGEMVKQNYPVVGVDVLRYFWEHKTAEQAATDLAATMAYYRKNWGVKSFVLAGYSFGADILPAIYNRLTVQDRDSVSLLVLLALAKQADFEIHVSGWLGQSGGEQPLEPELTQIAKTKILCIYGREEKAESACSDLTSPATILELPGGHHFDQDYPKLTRQILDVYVQHNITNKP